MKEEELQKIQDDFNKKGISFFLISYEIVEDKTKTMSAKNMTDETLYGVLTKQLKIVEYSMEQNIAKQFFDKK